MARKLTFSSFSPCSLVDSLLTPLAFRSLNSSVAKEQTKQGEENLLVVLASKWSYLFKQQLVLPSVLINSYLEGI